MASDLPVALAAFVFASLVVLALLTVVTSALLSFAARRYGISENEFLVGD
jgi:Na+-translocating ferredoxin:NAD+ oxidoreductase RNF subunit RnfB